MGKLRACWIGLLRAAGVTKSKVYEASLDLHVTTLTLSLILTLRLTLTLWPYHNPNPINPKLQSHITAVELSFKNLGLKKT